jgi:hypothetical protein
MVLPSEIGPEHYWKKILDLHEPHLLPTECWQRAAGRVQGVWTYGAEGRSWNYRRSERAGFIGLGQHFIAISDRTSPIRR